MNDVIVPDVTFPGPALEERFIVLLVAASVNLSLGFSLDWS